jgi:hypothetical protein
MPVGVMCVVRELKLRGLSRRLSDELRSLALPEADEL